MAEGNAVATPISGVYLRALSWGHNYTASETCYDVYFAAYAQCYWNLEYSGNYYLICDFAAGDTSSWTEINSQWYGKLTSYQGGQWSDVWALGMNPVQRVYRGASAISVWTRARLETPWGTSTASERYFYVPALAVPAGATGLTGSGSNSASHVLKWTKSNDGRTTGYRIYESKNGAAETLVATTAALTYTFGSREAGAYYTYKVVAYNVSGNSTVQPTILLYGTFLAPVDVEVTGYTAPSTVALSYKNPNAFDVHVAIECSPDNATWSVVLAQSDTLNAGATGAWTHNAAPAGTAYYRVRVISPSTSPYSAVVSQQTITAPTAPTDLNGTLTLGVTSGLLMKWSLAPTTAKPVTTVRWQWSSDNGTTWGNEGTSSSQAVTANRTMGQNAQLRFRVRTENAAGVSAWVTSDNYFGYVTSFTLKDTVIRETSGLPTAIGVTAEIPNYVRTDNLKMVISFVTETGVATGQSGSLNIVKGNTYAFEVPFFDAAIKVLTGTYRFDAYLTTESGQRISETMSSPTIVKPELVGAEKEPTFTGSGTAFTAVFNAASPYVCKRTFAITLYPYRLDIDQPYSFQGEQLAANATMPFVLTLNEHLSKVPVFHYEAVIKGYYNDGTVAYTKTFENEVTQGYVVTLNGEVMRLHLIDGDTGEVTEMFVDVIK